MEEERKMENRKTNETKNFIQVSNHAFLLYRNSNLSMKNYIKLLKIMIPYRKIPPTNIKF